MTPTPDIDVLLPSEEAVRARRDALVEELRRARAPRAGRAPRRLALVLAALVVAGGGVAASGVLSADDVKVEAGVGCYDRAALGADITVMHATEDPVAACAELWRKGTVDGTPRAEAPPLVACTDTGEPVRVMPGSGPEVCARLGLVPLPDDYPQAVRRTSTGADEAP